jgi:hypothetical protein
MLQVEQGRALAGRQALGLWPGRINAFMTFKTSQNTEPLNVYNFVQDVRHRNQELAHHKCNVNGGVYFQAIIGATALMMEAVRISQVPVDSRETTRRNVQEDIFI